MRIVITGGTGLIGRRLAADLAAAGYEVVVLSRSPDRARPPAGVRVCGWDGRTAHRWEEAADGADAIVNLAGENIADGRWTAARKQRILDSRTDAGAAVVQAVERARDKPRVVIQGSAVGYYGPCGDDAVVEGHAAGEDFLARVCVAWEASTAPVESQGVRRVVLRTGVVLSREGGALARMLLPFRLGLGGRLGSGRQWFPWIHIEDEVRAIRFLLENEGAAGAFNVTSFDPVTNAQFTRTLARVVRRPAILPVPAASLRLLFGEMASILLTGQRCVSRRLLEMGFRFRFPDPEGALRNLLED